jgi:hypothetical protein
MRYGFHRHIKMEAQVASVLKNGSLRVKLIDTTAPNARQRKPKNYVITNFEKDQWFFTDVRLFTVNATDRPFRGIFGSHVRNPNGFGRDIEAGETIRFDDVAENGNVWFYHNGERFKIEAGSLENLINRNRITELL